ncbi:hypothetical protein CFter6_2774 [Collimonas fungivorans]|jgi:uncharacterized membrane protein (UPF0127 family)|uniref:DUF192 domain-containing protein n=1 Tax=Collimonas fungivorans TaxID=158899 RepID=A0A127PCB4_9BURK|nr:DUF192 domain-containing protein [Collimonas fungivorans]AMO95442.1 hypothetical protein CFter6_2774 [Collimonas fungivorans]
MKIIPAYKNNQIIVANVTIGDTFFSRARGLMFTRTLAPDSAYLLKDCNSVHTFFMHFTIGVVYLSQDFIITKIVPVLARRSLSSDRSARHTLELHPATLASLSLRVGDQLRF